MLEVTALTPDQWQAWRALRLAALSEAPEAFGSTLAEWTGAGDAGDCWAGPADLLAVQRDRHLRRRTGGNGRCDRILMAAQSN